MTDITVTSASVVALAGANVKFGTCGETIPAGKSIALNPDTNKFMLADNDAVAAYLHEADGISVCSASLNQPIAYIKSGPLTIGATVVKGTVYCVSSTAGGICPQADIASGDTLCILGVATDTATLNVGINLPGVTL